MALYASYSTKTPNSALHDYSIVNNGDIYISSQDGNNGRSARRKRDDNAVAGMNVTLYTSVEGMELNNDFVIWTAEGDTMRRSKIVTFITSNCSCLINMAGLNLIVTTAQ